MLLTVFLVVLTVCQEGTWRYALNTASAGAVPAQLDRNYEQAARGVQAQPGTFSPARRRSAPHSTSSSRPGAMCLRV